MTEGVVRHRMRCFSKLIISHPPLEGGSKSSLSNSEKRISGRGQSPTIVRAPLPEKCLATLEFFDPPSRGGWEIRCFHKQRRLSIRRKRLRSPATTAIFPHAERR